MMFSVAMPWIFGLALAGAAGVTVLHLLSMREPPVRMLPTARFVPEGEARAVARQPRLSDRRLLALRVIALLALGAAFSGVQCGLRRTAVVDLVYVTPSLMRDSTVWMSQWRADSTANATRVVRALPRIEEDPGIAVIHALRDAAALAVRQPELEQVGMTVVLPPTIHSASGWRAWRQAWPARVQLLIVPADSTLAAATRDASSVVVNWPASGVPSGWQRLSRPDTVGAVSAGGLALVGPFERRARIDEATGRRDSTLTPIAWWSDGEIAATERRDGARCVRDVAVVIPTASDLLLSSSAQGLMQAVRAPCGGQRRAAALRDSGDGAWRVSAAMFRPVISRDVTSDPWWLGPMLVLVAVCALAGEWWWRRRSVVA